MQKNYLGLMQGLEDFNSRRPNLCRKMWVFQLIIHLKSFMHLKQQLVINSDFLKKKF